MFKKITKIIKSTLLVMSFDCVYTTNVVIMIVKVFVDQIFVRFDSDHSGEIDFKEFMLATNMSEAGDPREKLRWAFKAVQCGI